LQTLLWTEMALIDNGRLRRLRKTPMWVLLEAAQAVPSPLLQLGVLPQLRHVKERIRAMSPAIDQQIMMKSAELLRIFVAHCALQKSC
jgi:hypothetical protein